MHPYIPVRAKAVQEIFLLEETLSKKQKRKTNIKDT